MSRLLGGRYRLTGRLGRGGMGTVWRAHDEVLRRDVAVKELSLPRGLTDERRATLCERAMREARVSSRLRHRSIVRVHDVIAEDDRPWIVMELLSGRSLDHAGPQPPARVAQIGLAVLDALGAAHAQGVLHRDVKPGNVFLCDDGRVVLTDFGIATLEGDASLTVSGGLVGSPAYIAPERLRDEHAGPPSDLWSLGATLYAAVEGRSPFTRRTPAGTLSAVLTEEPPPPAQAGQLAPLLMAMLVKDPAIRPAADVVGAQLRLAAGQVPPPPAGPVPAGLEPTVRSAPGATVPAARRRRAVRRAVIPAAAVAAVAVVVPAVLLRDGGKPAAHSRPTGSPAQPDPVRGRFAAAPQACSLISAADAARLGARNTTPEPQGCTWGDSLNGYSIELQVQHFNPGGGLGAPGLARSYFADKKKQVTLSRHADDALHSSQSGINGVPATGDEAFGYDMTDGIDDGRSSVVWLRVSNLVVKVVYAHHAGTTDAARLHQGAITAAHAVSAALART